MEYVHGIGGDASLYEPPQGRIVRALGEVQIQRLSQFLE